MSKLLKTITLAGTTLAASAAIMGGGISHADSANINNVPTITKSQEINDTANTAKNNLSDKYQSDHDKGVSQAQSATNTAQGAGQRAAQQATDMAGTGLDMPTTAGGLNGIWDRINASLDSLGTNTISTLVRFASYALLAGMAASIVMAILGFFRKKGNPWRWVGGFIGLAFFQGLLTIVTGSTGFGANIGQMITWILTGN